MTVHEGGIHDNSLLDSLVGDECAEGKITAKYWNSWTRASPHFTYLSSFLTSELTKIPNEVYMAPFYLQRSVKFTQSRGFYRLHVRIP